MGSPTYKDQDTRFRKRHRVGGGDRIAASGSVRTVAPSTMEMTQPVIQVVATAEHHRYVAQPTSLTACTRTSVNADEGLGQEQEQEQQHVSRSPDLRAS